MLTFAVVVSRHGGPIPDRVLDRLRDRACDDVPFEVGSHLLWSNESGTVWFGGWQDASDTASAAHHWHVDDDGLTAFAGHIWPRRDGWRGSGPWAAQLAGHLRSTPLTEGDDLSGVHVAASLHPRGRCTVAADPFGIGHIYWGQGRDVIAIATRAALAAGVLAAEHGTAPKRDAIGVGWLAYSVQVMGLQTGFEQITAVPEGARVDIDPAGGARLVHAERSPWLLQSGGSASPEAVLEEVRNEMATGIRTARSLSGRTMRAGLTGGKDSRLMLALLLADGLAGEVEFETLGQTDLPDVVVARQIAEAFGLRRAGQPRQAESSAWRQARDAAVRDRGYGDLSSREIDLRSTAWAGSGARNALESLGRPPPSDQVVLSGMFGETMRTNYPGSTRLRSKQGVSQFPNNHGFGTAGILRPEALAHYRREMHRLLFVGCLETDSPQDVLDTFFIRRVRRWSGTAREIDPESRVFPLYSITGTRLAFAIGAENRHAEWIHYQLMRQACDPLVHIPFADKGWSAGADGGLVRPRRHREPAPAAPPTMKRPVAAPPQPPVRTVRGDRRAATAATDLDIMRRFLGEDASSALFDVIDPVATRHALDRFETLRESQRRQLYGALTAAIWLGGHEITLRR